MAVNRSEIVSQFQYRCNDEITSIESISDDAISLNQIEDVVARNHVYFSEQDCERSSFEERNSDR